MNTTIGFAMSGKLKGSLVTTVLAILAYFVFHETVHFTGDNSFALSCVALFCFITQYFTLYNNMDKQDKKTMSQSVSSISRT
jgi:uncharacterized membrane protein YoaT (DUF817 family)